MTTREREDENKTKKGYDTRVGRYTAGRRTTDTAPRAERAERRTKPVTCVLTPAEYEVVCARMKHKGYHSLSAYVRACIEQDSAPMRPAQQILAAAAAQAALAS